MDALGRISLCEISSEDEEVECRVCRGPAEEGRPLYAPCRCSGSIGLIHQECLKSWLEVTRGTKCELCSSVFKFAPKYADDAPENLSTFEVILGIFCRAGRKWLPFLLQLTLAAVLWLLALPLTTAYIYFAFLHRLSSIVTRWSFKLIVCDTVSGVIIVTVIFVSFFSFMSFVDFLQIHWQQMNQDNLNHIQEGDNEIPQNMDVLEVEDEPEFNANAQPEGLHRLLQVRERVIPVPEVRERIEMNNFLIEDAPHNHAINAVANREINVHPVIGARDAGDPNDQQNDLRPMLHRHRQPDNVDNVREQFNVLPNDGPRRVAALEVDDAMDMDINLALDELLGIHGPLRVLFRNVILFLLFIVAYLGFFELIPFKIGGSVYIALSNSFLLQFLINYILSNENIFTTIFTAIKLLNEESSRMNTLFKLPDLATILLGYISITFLVYIWQGIVIMIIKLSQFFVGKWRAPSRDNQGRIEGEEKKPKLSVVLEFVSSIIKVGILLFLKMLLLPFSLGVWLDAATLSLFDTSLQERIHFASNDIFSSFFLHWVAGITFMLLVTVSVLQLREVVHPNLLAKIIRPQEPQPDLLGNLLQESVATHAKRMLLSLGIYTLILSVYVWIPSCILVRSGLGALLPFFRLHFNYIFLPTLMTPIELLILHLCILSFLEKYKNGIGTIQHHFLAFTCEKLGITEYVLPCTVEKFSFVGFRKLNHNINLDEFDKYEVSKNAKDSKDKTCFSERPFVDSFWKELYRQTEPSDNFLISNMDYVQDDDCPIFETAITNRLGQRVLDASPMVTRIFYSKNQMLSLSSIMGSYRIRQMQKNGIDIIEFWKEVVGQPIIRPPDGWDDLGIGGAEVQGRWAWGDEKQSEIEEGIAKRKSFKSYKIYTLFLIKLFFLLLFSWAAIFVFVTVSLNTPLVIGRIFFYLLQIPHHSVHDTLCAVIGFAVIYFTVSFFSHSSFILIQPSRKVLHDWFMSFQRPASNSKLQTLFFTLSLWTLVSPTCIGILYYLCIVVTPIQWASDVYLPNFTNLLRSWLTGLLILHVWCAFCYVGIFTKEYWHGLFLNFNENNIFDNEQRNDGQNNVIGKTWQGKNGKIYNFFYTIRLVLLNWEWDKIDEEQLLKNFTIPIIRELGLCLIGTITAFIFVSYFKTYVPTISLIGYGRCRMFTFRLYALCMMLSRLCIVFRPQLHRWFKVAHKFARDDRYLIGEILLNYKREKG